MVVLGAGESKTLSFEFPVPSQLAEGAEINVSGNASVINSPFFVVGSDSLFGIVKEDNAFTVTTKEARAEDVLSPR